MRPTIARLFLFLGILAALATLAACGGSGSSGFDVAGLSENAVIEEVLASGDCRASGTLVICAASEQPEATPGEPSATPAGGRGVQLQVPVGTDAVPCALIPAADGCVFAVAFSSTGLPADATYRSAVRTANPEGSWIVGERATGSGSLFSFSLDSPAGAGSVQIAALVFTAGTDTTAGPVDTLEETGASFAFVTGSLAVAPAL